MTKAEMFKKTEPKERTFLLSGGRPGHPRTITFGVISETVERAYEIAHQWAKFNFPSCNEIKLTL
jgi:hypothetical protein